MMVGKSDKVGELDGNLDGIVVGSLDAVGSADG